MVVSATGCPHPGAAEGRGCTGRNEKERAGIGRYGPVQTDTPHPSGAGALPGAPRGTRHSLRAPRRLTWARLGREATSGGALRGLT